MTYENAPATALLATHCACCGRPLLDADSVQIGMGPTCRKRHGYNAGPSEKRPDANRAIHMIAVLAHKHPRAIADGVQLVKALGHLRAIGFEKCADHLAENVATVTIKEDLLTRDLTVVAPYNEAATDGFRRLPGRRWDGAAKANRLPRAAGMALLALLTTHYYGAIAVGPKGIFVVGATHADHVAANAEGGAA